MYLFEKITSELNLGRQRIQAMQKFFTKDHASRNRNKSDEASEWSAKGESDRSGVWRGKKGPDHAEAWWSH